MKASCAISIASRAHGRLGAAQRQARTVYGKLENLTLGRVFQGGLHEFVAGFIGENNQLGILISEQYLFYIFCANKKIWILKHLPTQHSASARPTLEERRGAVRAGRIFLRQPRFFTTMAPVETGAYSPIHDI